MSCTSFGIVANEDPAVLKKTDAGQVTGVCSSINECRFSKYGLDKSSGENKWVCAPCGSEYYFDNITISCKLNTTSP